MREFVVIPAFDVAALFAMRGAPNQRNKCFRRVRIWHSLFLFYRRARKNVMASFSSTRGRLKNIVARRRRIPASAMEHRIANCMAASVTEMA